MNINDIYPSKYVKASDLQGREIKLIIARYDVEKFGEETKLVLYFQGTKKGLATNRTNADRIAHSYGPDTDAWIGKEIVLYPDLVNFQGRTVDALRVRTPPRNGPVHSTAAPLEHHTVEHPTHTTSSMRPARAPDPLDDEIPF